MVLGLTLIVFNLREPPIVKNGREHKDESAHALERLVRLLPCIVYTPNVYFLADWNGHWLFVYASILSIVLFCLMTLVEVAIEWYKETRRTTLIDTKYQLVNMMR